MKNIEVKFGGEVYNFDGEILMKHLRKIELFNEKTEKGEFGKLDFFVEFALIMYKGDSRVLQEKLDNLNLAGIEEFTKNFEPVIEVLSKFNENNEKNKKKLKT